MSRLGDKIRRFMYGRYGTDNLNSFLQISVFVLLFLNIFLSMLIKNELARAIVGFSLTSIAFIFLFINIVRMFSKNIAARRKENMMYTRAKKAIKRFFTFNTSKGTSSSYRDDGFYIFRDCTKCGKTLRLPGKEGRNAVKCPACSHRFYVKAKKSK